MSSRIITVEPFDLVVGGVERRLHDDRNERQIRVALDSPRDLHYEPVVRRSQQLRDMGVDAITMADNAVATLRMHNMALADIVQREADVPVIVHLTCRDHNLLGLQSLLMAAHVQGLRHLLALTGDPARVGDQPVLLPLAHLGEHPGLCDLGRGPEAVRLTH